MVTFRFIILINEVMLLLLSRKIHMAIIIIMFCYYYISVLFPNTQNLLSTLCVLLLHDVFRHYTHLRGDALFFDLHLLQNASCDLLWYDALYHLSHDGDDLYTLYLLFLRVRPYDPNGVLYHHPFWMKHYHLDWTIFV